jgi:hypothetical protein
VSGGCCIYCGEPVAVETGYRRVRGWERLRRPPSDTKAFRAPERLDEYACWDCVRKLMAGISPAQEALL